MSDLYLYAQVAAVSAGIIFGAFAIFSPSWVWFKRQVFGWGGLTLGVLGTVLIVSSIFKSVTVIARPTGFEMRFSELEKEVSETRKLVSQTNSGFEEIRTALAIAGPESAAQLAKVQKKLESLSANVEQVNAATETALARWNAMIDFAPRGNTANPTDIRPEQKPQIQNNPIFAPAK
jgi:hypothetical protein